MKKRILAIVLAIMLVAAIMPFAAFAADGDPAITLTVGSVSADLVAGAEVRVPVVASDSTGYACGAAKFTWDPDALEFTGIEWTEQCPDLGSPEPANYGIQGIRFGDSLATENFAGEGLMFTLIFKITDTAAVGDYTVSLINPSIQDADIEKPDLVVTTIDGTVTLAEPATPDEPVVEPTDAPTEAPTDAPTEVPTEVPTDAPTEAPTVAPTEGNINSPKTGDTTDMALWILLVALSAAAVLVVLREYKRKSVFTK